jgi:hypothetical protein
MERLMKLPLEPGGTPEFGKVSEMFLEFAQPLMEIDPGGPPDIQAVRHIMALAMMCWNLPLLLAKQDASAAKTQRMFDDAMSQMPEPVRRALLRLIEDRTTHFALVPFHVLVSVEGTSLKDARIVAEARMSRVPAART